MQTQYIYNVRSIWRPVADALECKTMVKHLIELQLLLTNALFYLNWLLYLMWYQQKMISWFKTVTFSEQIRKYKFYSSFYIAFHAVLVCTFAFVRHNQLHITSHNLFLKNKFFWQKAKIVIDVLSVNQLMILLIKLFHKYKSYQNIHRHARLYRNFFLCTFVCCALDSRCYCWFIWSEAHFVLFASSNRSRRTPDILV